MQGIDLHIGRASVFIAVKNLLESLPTIERAEDAALRVWPIRMSGHCHEEPVGVPRIDRELRDLLPIAQAEMRPRLPCVRRLVNSIANREIRTVQSLAAADVDHLWVRERHRERAD